MIERKEPVNYIEFWYRKAGSNVESSFKSSQNSISIIVGGNLEVSFTTEDDEAKMKTIGLKDKEEIPTKLKDMVALLQTSLNVDPDNRLNRVLRIVVLDQIRITQTILNIDSENLRILKLRVNQFQGRDREISQGHP
ncbi:MAG TPA: hypothetical protein VKC54_04600 [Patescibacteria group bacterium]|nr:hypothetical protein [Patescibacteria group bacterium]